MVEVFSKEVVKEFVIQRLRLTPDTLGTTREDVPSVVRAIGGLQYGGHRIELFNRFRDFKSEWFDYWYEKHALIEGHVLRGALRILNVDEYPYYFKATRSVARKRGYHRCPPSLSDNHLVALDFIYKHGPFTPSEFKEMFEATYDEFKGVAKRLLYDLYNYGKIARMGRRNQKPLYHAVGKLSYELDMDQISEEQAKAWLFLKCLSIYGPFTSKDVAHWVGWDMTEPKETLKALLENEKISSVTIEDQQENHYIRAEDIALLNSLRNNLPEHSFIRILFNDDALLLGYYKRLENYFGYYWRYPQLSEGIAWRAAILHGRQLIGEAIVEMYANSKLVKVKKLTLREEIASSEMISKIKEEFERHARFQNKALEFGRIESIKLMRPSRNTLNKIHCTKAHVFEGI